MMFFIVTNFKRVIEVFHVRQQFGFLRQIRYFCESKNKCKGPIFIFLYTKTSAAMVGVSLFCACLGGYDTTSFLASFYLYILALVQR